MVTGWFGSRLRVLGGILLSICGMFIAIGVLLFGIPIGVAWAVNTAVTPVLGATEGVQAASFAVGVAVQLLVIWRLLRILGQNPYPILE